MYRVCGDRFRGYRSYRPVNGSVGAERDACGCPRMERFGSSRTREHNQLRRAFQKWDMLWALQLLGLEPLGCASAARPLKLLPL